MVWGETAAAERGTGAVREAGPGQEGEGQEGAILAFFHSPGRFDKAALAAYMLASSWALTMFFLYRILLLPNQLLT